MNKKIVILPIEKKKNSLEKYHLLENGEMFIKDIDGNSSVKREIDKIFIETPIDSINFVGEYNLSIKLDESQEKTFDYLLFTVENKYRNTIIETTNKKFNKHNINESVFETNLLTKMFINEVLLRNIKNKQI